VDAPDLSYEVFSIDLACLPVGHDAKRSEFESIRVHCVFYDCNRFLLNLHLLGRDLARSFTFLLTNLPIYTFLSLGTKTMVPYAKEAYSYLSS